MKDVSEYNTEVNRLEAWKKRRAEERGKKEKTKELAKTEDKKEKKDSDQEMALALTNDSTRTTMQLPEFNSQDTEVEFFTKVGVGAAVVASNAIIAGLHYGKTIRTVDGLVRIREADAQVQIRQSDNEAQAARDVAETERRRIEAQHEKDMTQLEEEYGHKNRALDHQIEQDKGLLGVEIRKVVLEERKFEAEEESRANSWCRTM